MYSEKDHAFSSGNTHYIYDRQGRLIAEADSFGGGGREYIYLDGLPVAMADGNDLYFIHADHLGAPQKMTDEKGKIAWERLAGPFGDTLDIKAKGKPPLNLRFPGQYHDDESGLDYNFHRSYDPALGRYTQSDPIGLLGGINTYVYVGGNPVNRVDPWGLASECKPDINQQLMEQNIGPAWKKNPPEMSPKDVCELTAGLPCKYLLRTPGSIQLKAGIFGACEIATSAACMLIPEENKKKMQKNP